MLSGLPTQAAEIVKQAYCGPAASVEALMDTAEAIADAIDSPMVDVQFGPAGVQWCSPELLRAIADRSAQTGRRVQMHLLETIYQREWADKNYPQGIVR